MKFLSASTFHPLAFLGLILVTATAFPTSGVLREEFGSDTIPNRPTEASSQIIEEQITLALKEILAIRKKMCNNDENCINDEVAVSKNVLNIPAMTQEDECFQIRYNWDTCLLKITSSLLEFQVYLEFIKDELQDKGASSLQNRTILLIQILKQKVKNPEKIIAPSPTATASLLEKLKSQNEREKTMAIHYILFRLQEFLQFSLRAMRNA